MDGAVSSGIDPDILRRADRVIVLGTEAIVDPVPGMRSEMEVGVTDEPSYRGVEGILRMRLIRDDIAERIQVLLHDLGVPSTETGTERR